MRRAALILALAVLPTALPAAQADAPGAVVSSRLQARLERIERAPATAAQPVTVILERAGGQVVEALVAAHGGNVRYRKGDVRQVSVPGNRLRGLLRALPAGTIARLSYLHSPAVVTSQGVAKTGAQDMQDLGDVGTGAKIGVIDVGFGAYATSQAAGELPSGAGLTVTDYTGNGTGGSTHGTEVAEIVHDMAPGADLYLAKVSTDVELDMAMQDMVTAGVDVINHSVIWVGGAFYDGTGPMCDITDAAQSGGILWVNAAGNERRKHYLATFSDTDGDLRHEFAAGQDYNTVTASAGQFIVLILNWDDYPDSSVDYDLYLYDGDPEAGGTLKDSSTNTQWKSGPQHYPSPSESLSYPVTVGGTYYIVVSKRNSSTPDLPLTLFSFEHNLAVQTNNTSMPQPGDCDSVLAVGATKVADDAPDGFSSEGPTTDGRDKPDMSGPDRVATSMSSSFAGTSAASPHVAGAAGLLAAVNPGWTPAQLQAELVNTSFDVHTAGFDYRTGAGRLSLDADGDGLNHDTDNCPLDANPAQTDTDDDGAGDACDTDDDNDGLSDALEISIGTDPLLWDSDGDGLDDYFEVGYDGDAGAYIPGLDLDPLSVDTDGDGFDDDVEVGAGSDPLDALDTPATGDINDDGVVDAADLMLALEFTFGTVPDAGQMLRGDVAPLAGGIPAPDGQIDAGDVLLIQRKILGLPGL